MREPVRYPIVMNRSDDGLQTFDEPRFIAEAIPGAKFVELPGKEHDLEDRGSRSRRRTGSWLLCDLDDEPQAASATGNPGAADLCPVEDDPPVFRGMEPRPDDGPDAPAGPDRLAGPGSPFRKAELAMEQITSLGHLFGVPLRAAHHPGVRPDRPPI